MPALPANRLLPQEINDLKQEGKGALGVKAAARREYQIIRP